jgi:hypothetical protein
MQSLEKALRSENGSFSCKETSIKRQMILIKFGIAIRMNKIYVMLQKLCFYQNTLWTKATGTAVYIQKQMPA